RTVQRWLRSRQFQLLVAAEEGDPGEGGPGAAERGEGRGSAAPPPPPAAGPGPQGRGRVVACATLSLLQPEALLPPPFPSGKPFRLYVSNMSVLPGHRRRGLARRLLERCERVARLWGHSSLWLHVKRKNATAAALYRSCGFRPVQEGRLRLLAGPLSQLLMVKELPPLRQGCPVVLTRGATGVAAAGARAAVGEVQEVEGAARKEDGVFVWSAVVEDQATTAGE
ncbi:hypothetical protein TSOC_015289, partial [Tetrabaena socialis]